MPHPYYQPRQNHKYPIPLNYTVSQAERLSAHIRVRRRASVGGLSRVPSRSIRGGLPERSEGRNSENRRRAKNMPSRLPPSWHIGYPSSIVPTQLLHCHPVHALPYSSPLHPSTYIFTPIVPVYLEPHRVHSMSTRPMNVTAPSSKLHEKPLSRPVNKGDTPSTAALGPAPSQSAADTTARARPRHPHPPSSYTFHCDEPGSASRGYPNFPWPGNGFSGHADTRNMTRMPEAWESQELAKRAVPCPLSTYAYVPVLPLEAVPRGLVLPRAGDSQMNWPPKNFKLDSKQWMIHPCLLWVENEIVQTSWKWDMSKYPTRDSILELPPNGIVCPLGSGDLDAPVIYPPMKDQKVKIFVNDFPVKPLEISGDNLTVGSLFLALWEFLNQHMRNDWRSWLTKRDLQYVIPTLETNRSVRLEKIGRLAAIAELERPPKWIDVFGDLVFFGGLIPLMNDDPQDETRVFKLRHISWD